MNPLSTVVQEQLEKFEREFFNLEDTSSVNQFRPELAGRLPKAFEDFLLLSHRALLAALLREIKTREDSNLKPIKAEWESQPMDYEYNSGYYNGYGNACDNLTVLIQDALKSLEEM